MSEKWEKWFGVERARFLSIQEYFTALETQLTETTEEEFLSDKVFGGTLMTASQAEDEFSHDKETVKTLYLENTKRLLELIDPTNVNRQLLMAELNRNLGNFEECLSIIVALIILI